MGDSMLDLESIFRKHGQEVFKKTHPGVDIPFTELKYDQLKMTTQPPRMDQTVEAASRNGIPLSQKIDRKILSNATDAPMESNLASSFTQSKAEINMVQGAYFGSGFNRTLPYRVQDPGARAVFGSTLQLTGESHQVKEVALTTTSEEKFTIDPQTTVEAVVTTQYKEYSTAFELITTLKGPITAVCFHPHTGNKIFYEADIYETLNKRRSEVLTEGGVVTLNDYDRSISIHIKGDVHYRIGVDYDVDFHPYTPPAQTKFMQYRR